MNNLYVLRAHDPEKTLAFFQGLGLHFVREQHGEGPVHYSCEMSGKVFEIYPRTSKGGDKDRGEFLNFRPE